MPTSGNNSMGIGKADWRVIRKWSVSPFPAGWRRVCINIRAHCRMSRSPASGQCTKYALASTPRAWECRAKSRTSPPSTVQDAWAVDLCCRTSEPVSGFLVPSGARARPVTCGSTEALSPHHRSSSDKQRKALRGFVLWACLDARQTTGDPGARTVGTGRHLGTSRCVSDLGLAGYTELAV